MVSKVKHTREQRKRGFTLIELLVVIFMIGVLSAIAAPGWLRFLSRHQVMSAQDELHQGIQRAQQKSQQESISWQLSIREDADFVEYATHPSSTSPSFSAWKPLGDTVVLDGETNFASSGNVSYVQFDEKGNVRYRLGRVTLSSKRFPDIKHCVIVSTLIGNSRLAQERDVQVDNKFCY